MNIRIGSAVIALAVFLAAESLRAHHSLTPGFDLSKKVAVVGTLAKVDWRNPHIGLSLDAKGDRGQAEAWVIEAYPPSYFRSHNLSKSDFEKAIGQIVTVEVVRAKDGSLYGYLQKITFPDGKAVRLTDLVTAGP